MQFDMIRAMAHYSDWANGQLIEAAERIDDAKLDEPIEMGMGSLRRTLIHLLSGESVWLARWKNETETPWPNETRPMKPATIREAFIATWQQREAFLASLSANDLPRVQTYRDSKGELFKASLSDMIIQGLVHSIHHRAQAVNMIRRLGGTAPDVDYMYRVRQPA